MVADGGIVRAIIKAARGRTAIAGTWTGGRWSPHAGMTVGVHRNGRLQARVDVAGIDQPRGAADALLLVSDNDAPLFQVLDVITFGDAMVEEYAVQDVPPETMLPAVASIGRHHLRAVIDMRESGQWAAVFFGDPGERPTGLVQNAELPRGTINLLMRPRYDVLPAANEIVLNGNAVTLSRVVRTLNPLRNFAMSAGQEMLHGHAKKRGRLSRETIQKFDMPVSAETGSFRVVLQRPETAPRQLTLFVQPTEPYQLLAAVVAAAIEKDEGRLFAELAWHRVFSVHRLLANVRDLAAQEAEVRTTSGSLQLTWREVAWLDLMLRTPEREVTIVGEMFGADMIRKWCRIASHEEREEVRWTLYFRDEVEHRVRALLMRRVRVTFRTSTPESVRGGSGRLVDIGEP